MNKEHSADIPRRVLPLFCDMRIEMKKISKQTVRSKAVGNVLASLRIEHLTPGDYVEKGINACLTGEKTTASVLQDVMRHHVALQRV